MRQPNVQQMMKQVQKMQQTMAAEQEKLKDEGSRSPRAAAW